MREVVALASKIQTFLGRLRGLVHDTLRKLSFIMFNKLQILLVQMEIVRLLVHFKKDSIVENIKKSNQHIPSLVRAALSRGSVVGHALAGNDTLVFLSWRLFGL